MSQITLKCKKCGTQILFDTNESTVTCLHCGSTFLINDLLDENENNLNNKTTSAELTKMIDFKEALRQGDSSLYQGNYEKSEESFKKAIEIEPDNFKGYFGVVKAKTHNFNIYPDDSIKEYCKKALSLAEEDDFSFLKNEFSKLGVLKHEKRQLAISKKQKTKKVIGSKRKKIIKRIIFISAIALVGVALILWFVVPAIKK